MESKTPQFTGGIGLGGALFILFLALKLTGVIGWSWLWITAPLWIPLAIIAALLGVIAIGAAIVYLKKP